MKRKLQLFMIAVFAFASVLSMAAMADGADDSGETEPTISAFSEQTQWYYRAYNGKLQRRLWSLTYEKWLTDWIDC